MVHSFHIIPVPKYGGPRSPLTPYHHLRTRRNPKRAPRPQLLALSREFSTLTEPDPDPEPGLETQLRGDPRRATTANPVNQFHCNRWITSRSRCGEMV